MGSGFDEALQMALGPLGPLGVFPVWMCLQALLKFLLDVGAAMQLRRRECFVLRPCIDAGIAGSGRRHSLIACCGRCAAQDMRASLHPAPRHPPFSEVLQVPDRDPEQRNYKVHHRHQALGRFLDLRDFGCGLGLQ